MSKPVTLEHSCTMCCRSFETPGQLKEHVTAAHKYTVICSRKKRAGGHR